MIVPAMTYLLGRNAKDGIGNPEVNPYGTLNPEQVQINKYLGKYLGTALQPAEYTGTLTAPITAGEQANVAQQSRLSALSGQSLTSLIDPNLEQYNRDFETMVAQPSYKKFIENDLPVALENSPFASTEYLRQKTAGLTDLNSTLGSLRYQGLNDARNRQLNAITAANQLATTNAAVQAIPREVQQAGYDREYAEFTRQNQEKTAAINQMLNFLGISTGTVQQDPTLEILLALLNAGANVGSALATGA